MKKKIFFAVFLLSAIGITSLIEAPFPDPTILTTILTNGSIFECGTAGAGSCSGIAFNANSTSASKNWTGSYNFLFVLNSTQNQDEYVDTTAYAVQARDPAGTTYGVSNFVVYNSTNGIPCNGGGCNTGYEFRGTVDGRATNFTMQFHYHSVFQGGSNVGIINVSLDINDLAGRKVILPTPSTYCADNYTLIVTNPRLVFNGTQQVIQNITTIKICDAGIVCNNNSFFGPACDPPTLQQPLYLAGLGIGIIVIMSIIVSILKKVIG